MKPLTKLKKRSQGASGFATGWNQHLGGKHARRAEKWIRRWFKRDLDDEKLS